MRIPLFAYPWRVSKARTGRKDGSAFWRIAVYGSILREACDCDAVQSCVVFRHTGIVEGGVDDDGPYDEYDPRTDCTCIARQPHTHTRLFGRLLDAPVQPTGVFGVLREAATKEPW